jgi:hypothetical protein
VRGSQHGTSAEVLAGTAQRSPLQHDKASRAKRFTAGITRRRSRLFRVIETARRVRFDRSLSVPPTSSNDWRLFCLRPARWQRLGWRNRRRGGWFGGGAVPRYTIAVAALAEDERAGGALLAPPDLAALFAMEPDHGTRVSSRSGSAPMRLLYQSGRRVSSILERLIRTGECGLDNTLDGHVPFSSPHQLGAGERTRRPHRAYVRPSPVPIHR